MLKNTAKSAVVHISWFFARLYIHKYKPIIIGVTGSVGKTGTKRAIAHMLTTEKRVAWQDGNYNDIVTVPLVFFGLNQPSLFNPLAWVFAFVRMIKLLTQRTGAEVVVLELGTDAPGQISQFGKHLMLDYAVVTAISPEHMENFGNIQAVADEELTVLRFSRTSFVDYSIIKNGFIKNGAVQSYGTSELATVCYRFEENNLTIKTGRSEIIASPSLIGDHQNAALAVAAALAQTVGISDKSIAGAIHSLQPMPGRMQPLSGKDGSLIIDDTYNASPIAIQAALEYLYARKQKHKIAVIGNMNEMGDLSADLHTELANDKRLKNLDLIITIGSDANKYFAVAARKHGCNVRTYDSPVAIGEYLSDQKLANTALLFKGSQNGVFLEEAIKPILANSDDSKKLVRQSDYWLRIKQKQFGSKS